MYSTRDFTVNCALTQYLVWVIQILMILFSPSTWCIIIAFLDELQAERKYLVLMNSGLLCVVVSAVQQICIHPWRIYYAQGRTSPFLPHLPLPVSLACGKQNNLFFSICYWSPQPWHFTLFTGHTPAFLSVMSFVRNRLSKYSNLFTGCWPRAKSHWQHEVFYLFFFFLYLYFILQAYFSC